ncbi:MAG: malonate decarboxylase delta subunit [Janthinobacterium sp.]|jgi:malonate decarboxylase delta subunit
MEKMSYEFPAGAPARGRALAGVVGSGDLEVLLEPGLDGVTTVAICTSVDGMNAVWQTLLERILKADASTVDPLPAVRLDINDFGATPGVVRLRIEQAFDELKLELEP